MPLDKPIDFYITEIEGEQGDPIDEEALVINAHIPPDELSVTCNLPEGLNNERLKIHALVHLEPNDLNLRGMTFDEIEPELKAGIALYGSSDGTQLILDGESITKFKFYGYTQ